MTLSVNKLIKGLTLTSLSLLVYAGVSFGSYATVGTMDNINAQSPVVGQIYALEATVNNTYYDDMTGEYVISLATSDGNGWEYAPIKGEYSDTTMFFLKNMYSDREQKYTITYADMNTSELYDDRIISLKPCDN